MFSQIKKYITKPFVHVHSFVLQLLKKDEDGNYNKSAILACTQIVDCLVENVLRIEEKGAGKDKLFALEHLMAVFVWLQVKCFKD